MKKKKELHDWMKFYPATMDKHKFRRMMQNAETLNDHKLDEIAKDYEKLRDYDRMQEFMYSSSRS